MKVLVVGGGGREHALAWKLSQSERIQKVFVAPGNGGTARDPNLIDVPITEVKALREWAQQEKSISRWWGLRPHWAAGIVDEFRAHGMKIFGPTKAAAQLESSKSFF
jgi:phosphoribosylamine---glycine ligase